MVTRFVGKQNARPPFVTRRTRFVRWSLNAGTREEAAAANVLARAARYCRRARQVAIPRTENAREQHVGRRCVSEQCPSSCSSFHNAGDEEGERVRYSSARRIAARTRFVRIAANRRRQNCCSANAARRRLRTRMCGETKRLFTMLCGGR